MTWQEPWDDGTLWADGTGFVDRLPFARITVTVRGLLPPPPPPPPPLILPISEWQGASLVDVVAGRDGTWFGAPDPGTVLVDGGGQSAFLDRVDDYGEVTPTPDFSLSAVTLRFFVRPASTPALVDGHKFMLVNSDGVASGPGSFSIERKDDRLAAYVRDADGSHSWFVSSDGIPDAIIPAGAVSQIDLVMGPGGARIGINGVVVASLPEIVNGWTQPEVGFRIGTWKSATPDILYHGEVGPILLYDMEMPLSTGG